MSSVKRLTSAQLSIRSPANLHDSTPPLATKVSSLVDIPTMPVVLHHSLLPSTRAYQAAIRVSGLPPSYIPRHLWSCDDTCRSKEGPCSYTVIRSELPGHQRLRRYHEELAAVLWRTIFDATGHWTVGVDRRVTSWIAGLWRVSAVHYR